MRQHRVSARIDNRPYQQQIAISLVNSLGMDDAIDFCVQNGWEETLCVILKDDRHYTEMNTVTVN